MPYEIIRADITKLKVDAIVNSANTSLLGGGDLEDCQVGQSKVTKGHNLQADYVIHTVGPIWQGGNHGEEALLRSCYRSALKVATDLGLNHVAFALISSDVFGYPKGLAIYVAQSEIRAFLNKHEMMISLVVFDRKTYDVAESTLASVKAYIDDHYVHSQWDARQFLEKSVKCSTTEAKAFDLDSEEQSILDVCEAGISFETTLELPYKKKKHREKFELKLETSFSEHLLTLIDSSGMTDVQTYKRANIDRKLFSKIRGDKYYQPKKQTALALAIALELDLEQTHILLQKAGYALSKSSVFDLVITYFIESRNYDIYEINDVLFKMDEPLLCAKL